MGHAPDTRPWSDFLARRCPQSGGRGSSAGRAHTRNLSHRPQAIDGAHRTAGRRPTQIHAARRVRAIAVSAATHPTALAHPPVPVMRITPPTRWWVLPIAELWDFRELVYFF